MFVEVNMFEFPFFMLGLFLMIWWVLAKPARRNRDGEWRVIIDTDSSPKHTYELGPYDTREEASKSSADYIKKLEDKGTNQLKVNINKVSDTLNS
jgi:hypothetical protein